MSECLSEEELDRFHGREWDAASMERARRHMSTCRECARRAAAMAEEVNHLIENIKQVGASNKPVTARTNDEAEPLLAEWPSIAGYRILRKIGEGGMGIVFEAEQADTRRYVALKVIRGGPYVSDTAVRLFRREVRTLARLEHPGIAHLYEAGRTDSGQHYFAMELVHGESVVEFVNRRKLPLDERMHLCAKICDAVHYAHQNAVIHRDLKPGNILVTERVLRSELRRADGSSRSSGSGFEIKILDFGLAKITDADEKRHMTVTAAGQVFGTLEYMSPEQAQGKTDELDTRTDIYSLGVLSYEILTGTLPYEVSWDALIEAVRVIVEQPPRRAGSVNRALRGDVEAILLKALEKEKSRRYASAGALAEDLQRYLSHLPVVARPPSAAYQIRKFVRRHAALTGLAATVFLSVATIAVVASVQRARAEAAEARTAIRFNQVRELAHTFIFDFHDKIADLAGATPVREFLVETALAYLDSLAEDASDDPLLLRDLAAAYLKVGDVQGNPYGANLGDSNGALRSYRRSLEIRQALVGNDADNVGLRRDLAASHDRVARIQTAVGRPGDALLSVQESLKIVESISRGSPDDLRARHDVSVGHDRVGRAYAALGRLPEALAGFRASLAITEQLSRAEPDSPGPRRALAIGYLMIGDTLESLGRSDEALAQFTKSLDLGRTLVQEDPDNATLQRDLATNYERVGGIRLILRRPDDALASYREGRNIWKRMVRADPADVRAQRGLSISHNRIGDIHKMSGRVVTALPSYREAVQIAETLALSDPDSVLARRDLALSSWKLGSACLELGLDQALSWEEQLRHCREARTALQRASKALVQLRDAGLLPTSDADYPAQILSDIADCEATIDELRTIDSPIQ